MERIFGYYSLNRCTAVGFHHYHATGMRILRTGCYKISGGIVLGEIFTMSGEESVNLAQRLFICEVLR